MRDHFNTGVFWCERYSIIMYINIYIFRNYNILQYGSWAQTWYICIRMCLDMYDCKYYDFCTVETADFSCLVPRLSIIYVLGQIFEPSPMLLHF